MNRILIVIVAALLAQDTWACQYTSNANELAGARSDRAEMKTLVSELGKRADAIFIASVKSRDQYSFSFRDIVNLKGETKEGSSFSWEQRLEELIIGCTGVTNFAQVSIPEEDFENGMLVYVKGKKILRLNHVGSFAGQPSGYEEVEWLSK